MGLNAKHFYEFGPFCLEPAERLLLQADRPVPLTPKAFELLVFLVQNSGRLVTKDQIMKAVWPESFVEEANLTVWISVLRKALGDREGGSHYIETVPKKGYRFTAEVKEATVPVPVAKPAVESVAVSAEDSRSDANSNSPAAVAPPALEITAPEAILNDSASRVVSTKAVPEVYRKPWLSISVIVVLLCLSAAISYIIYLRKSAAKRSSVAPRTLAILPFQNLQPDASNDFLGYSLADAVITKMDYVSSLSVRPSTAIEKYRNQAIDIPRVAAELNADTLLSGNFIREGDDLRITYQLIDVKANTVVGRGTIDLKYNNLLQVQDKVAQEIIRILKVDLTPSEAEQIKPDTSVDPLAYEYYLRGVDLYGQNKFPMAIKMLEKSTETDPNYAPAWAYLGTSHTADAAFEFGGREQYRRAQAAYERALAIRPSQLDAQIFLANLLIDTGKVEQAVPLLRDALKTNPNHATAHWELGYAYRFAGMLKESVAECERARSLDPLVKANSSAFNTYLYLGEYDKFLRSLPEVDDSSFLLFYRGLGEYYQKDFERAARDFDRAYEVDPSLYAQIGKAISQSIAHREADGLEILRGLERKIEHRGVRDPEAMYKIAQAYSILGDKPSALRVLRSSVEGGFFSYPYLAADPLLDPLRREPEFAEILNTSRRRHEAFKSRFFLN
jgi:DNA-binding winged helix-turn-helix (wHTH) protein/TolB-like protein/Tfp pilus assembly protein PilF